MRRGWSNMAGELWAGELQKPSHYIDLVSQRHTLYAATLRRSIIARSPSEAFPRRKIQSPDPIPTASRSGVTVTNYCHTGHSPSRPDFPSWAARSSVRTPLSHLSSGATLSPCGRDQVQLVSNQNVTSSFESQTTTAVMYFSPRVPKQDTQTIDSTSQTKKPSHVLTPPIPHVSGPPRSLPRPPFLHLASPSEMAPR
jgi:hypothetical protein